MIAGRLRARLLLRWAVVLAGLLAAPPLRAERPIHAIDWSALKEQGKLSAGKLIADGPGGTTALRLDNEADAPRTFVVLSLEDPGIRELRWRVQGQVRYRDVQGQGYLDLQNVLPQGTFFTRTLAPAGLLQGLSGSSDWRAFELPFDATRGGQPPTKLELRVVLPGRGTVDLGPLEIYEQEAGAAARGAPWWPTHRAGWWFGILGALFGCLAGLTGTLVGLGRARRWVFGLRKGLLVGCALAIVAALGAIVLGQPFEVFYPPLLVGIIGVVVIVATHRATVRRYQDLELRKIRAMDAPM